MSKNVLLISDEMIKDRTSVHGNVDPKLLYPDIKAAQDMYIHRLLGSALYNKLISDIQSTGTTTGVYKTLLDDYIVDALMYYVLSELPITLSYQFWNKGVVRKTGENTESPSMTELVDIGNTYKKRAEFYGERLRLYLVENQTSYTEYQNPGNGADTMYPEKESFTMPIWLGEDDCDDRSYEEKYQGNKPRC